MLTFDSIPQARVVSKGGQQFAPPRAPRSHDRTPITEHLRTAVAVALGMWPLTGVILLSLALMYIATMAGAP